MLFENILSQENFEEVLEKAIKKILVKNNIKVKKEKISKKIKTEDIQVMKCSALNKTGKKCSRNANPKINISGYAGICTYHYNRHDFVCDMDVDEDMTCLLKEKFAELKM